MTTQNDFTDAHLAPLIIAWRDDKRRNERSLLEVLETLQPLVKRIVAARYSRGRYPDLYDRKMKPEHWDEFMEAGRIGIWKAADRWDRRPHPKAKPGYGFKYYAQLKIGDELNRCASEIGIGPRQHDQSIGISKDVADTIANLAWPKLGPEERPVDLWRRTDSEIATAWEQCPLRTKASLNRTIQAIRARSAMDNVLEYDVEDQDDEGDLLDPRYDRFLPEVPDPNEFNEAKLWNLVRPLVGKPETDQRAAWKFIAASYDLPVSEDGVVWVLKQMENGADSHRDEAEVPLELRRAAFRRRR